MFDHNYGSSRCTTRSRWISAGTAANTTATSTNSTTTTTTNSKESTRWKNEGREAPRSKLGGAAKNRSANSAPKTTTTTGDDATTTAKREALQISRLQLKDLPYGVT